MASILSAGTTNSTALNLTADTSGSLILASNNNVTAVTIATNQNVTFANNATFPTTIGVGGATPSASGSGISFPASQSASSNANTLDDYEEGTWTPTISGGYTGVTYTNQAGWYTKVGRFVNISGRIQFSGTANAGLFSIIGLPFSQGNIGGGAYGGGGIPYSNLPVITNTSPYTTGNTVEYYTMGGGAQIASSGNASNQWISFVITIATD